MKLRTSLLPIDQRIIIGPDMSLNFVVPKSILAFQTVTYFVLFKEIDLFALNL